MDCQKHEDEIKKQLTMNSAYRRQTLERIYYSHRHDTCVDIIYSIYPGNIKEGIDGKQTIEINDMLNKRNLWRREYPAAGGGSWTHEEVIADAYQKIREQGWGDN